MFIKFSMTLSVHYGTSIVVQELCNKVLKLSRKKAATALSFNACGHACDGSSWLGSYR